MTKEKSLALTAAIYGIIFATYNILIFVIFSEFSAVFWLSYAFTLIAFAAQCISMYFALKRHEIETIFFGMPLTSLSFFYLIAQAVVGVIFMFFQGVNTTIPFVIQLLMLAIFLVVAIIAIMARDTVMQVADDIKTKTVQHKSTHIDVEMLYTACTHPELKERLRKLAQTIKYSDPMTNDAIADVEYRIMQKLSELRVYVDYGENDEAMQACKALELLYVERNKKLLISK